jgi:hypothetical protein
MQALEDSIGHRPFALVSSKNPQNFPSDVTTEVTYDFIEADNAQISGLGSQPARLTPTSPGFWVVWGALELPSNPMRSRDVFLRVNGVDVARYDQHDEDPTGPFPIMMTIMGMSFMDGVDDYFTMTFNPDQSSSDVKVGNKKLGCFRMTAS